MKIKPIFAWYDFWIGFFWDAKKSRLYVFPLPMFGFYMTIYGKKCWVLRKRGYFYRPHSKGYTADISEAGRYTLAEALEHRYGGEQPTTMHHIGDFL